MSFCSLVVDSDALTHTKTDTKRTAPTESLALALKSCAKVLR
jgi:hypothetical protein